MPKKRFGVRPEDCRRVQMASASGDARRRNVTLPFFSPGFREFSDAVKFQEGLVTGARRKLQGVLQDVMEASAPR